MRNEPFAILAQHSAESYPVNKQKFKWSYLMKYAVSIPSHPLFRRVICLLAITCYTSMPLAQQRLYGVPNAEEIANALAKPKLPGASSVTGRPLSRGLMLEKPEAEERVTEQRQPDQKSNSNGASNASTGKVGAGKQGGLFLSSVPEQKPASSSRAVDLEIQFAFGSDRLTAEGRAVLDQLGTALRSDALSDVTGLILEGHTDGIGNPQSNLALSLRRAKAAQVYLTQRHRINPNAIQALGKGATELAAPTNPADGINRRVRVIVEG
jgi:OmpA-OmpF porin, OOP family